MNIIETFFAFGTVVEPSGTFAVWNLNTSYYNWFVNSKVNSLVTWLT